VKKEDVDKVGGHEAKAAVTILREGTNHEHEYAAGSYKHRAAA
jgi:hypothetical protein